MTGTHRSGLLLELGRHRRVQQQQPHPDRHRADYYSGSAHYAAWWEILPAAETSITSITVHPGDHMTARSQRLRQQLDDRHLRRHDRQAFTTIRATAARDRRRMGRGGADGRRPGEPRPLQHPDTSIRAPENGRNPGDSSGLGRDDSEACASVNALEPGQRHGWV